MQNTMKLIILDRDGTINSDSEPTGQVRMLFALV